MICDNCKKFFMAGNRPDGIPNGIRMILSGNRAVTLCAECVMDIGRMDEQQKDEFFKNLKGKKVGS